jgi:exodeoxyribonuclease V gamma subunit
MNRDSIAKGHLRLFTGNRLEILADQLAAALAEPLPSSLEPETIVVQSKGMERWICLQLAERHGICANCLFPFPNAFVRETFEVVLGYLPSSSLFDPEIMTWRVMKALPSLVDHPAFESLRIYLRSGRSDLKRLQLSQRIADLFDQYLLFRPEMMFQWEKGEARHWQAVLWRELVRDHGQGHRAALAGAFFDALRERPPTGLPARISVFGISALPRFHIQVLAALSQVVRVNLFLMNPSREYWGDILDAREMKKLGLSEKEVQEEYLHMERGNSLLASMGALGRDFLEMIQDLQAEEVSCYAEPEKGGLLNAIQGDILDLKERKEKSAICSEDRSLRIHSCHSPMREVEVLRDQLLRMFEEIPGLLPRDILVMMPDIESYAPYIQAVFDTELGDPRRIPFSIADRSVRREGGISDIFLDLLDLHASRFGVVRILNLLECRAVRRRFGFLDDDLETIRRWVSDTRIRWGIDEDHKRSLGLPSFSQNTWRAGLDRLLLGFAMPGREERLFSGILPYDPIEGNETRILGSLVGFAETLFSLAASLRRPRTLEGWQREMAKLLEECFEPGEETEREIQVIRRILDDLVHAGSLSSFEEELPLVVIRTFLEGRLDQTGFGYGFITGGVTFCAMLPMRSIPFRVICLLGMDSEAYPRPSSPLGFDLMARYPKRGDRSRRNDDRYLFLETVLSARDRLYISYVGQSIQDNTAIPPSVLVSELIDYVEQGFEVPDGDILTHLRTKHRLQAFSPEYFKGPSKLFTYAVEHFEIAGISAGARKEPEPFVVAGLSEPDRNWRKVDLRSFCAFFSNPAKFLLNRRLGIHLEEATSLMEEREPFEVQTLERYLLEQDMVRRLIRGGGMKEGLALSAASGRLPHGPVGRCIYGDLSPGVERFARDLLTFINGEALDTLDFQVPVGPFSVAGSLDHVFKDNAVHYRYARLKGKDFIVGWIHHLVLNMLRPKGLPRDTLIAGLSMKRGRQRERAYYRFEPVERAETLLQALLNRYWEGLRRPLPFFTESSWAYAGDRLAKGKAPALSLETARKTWQGSGWDKGGRGECEDPYYERCFRSRDPLDSAFEDLAVEVFGPLLESLSEVSMTDDQ